jgi:YfiH family protein
MTTLPAVPETFEWIPQPWGLALRCRPLGQVAPHLFTTRQLELSPLGLGVLADALASGDVVVLKQVHGAGVVVARRGHRVPGRPSDAPTRDIEGDVLVSDDPGVAIAVRAADCVPLLMADRVRGVVAAVHAGWRGTAARAAVAAVDALGTEFGTGAEDLVVAIGPSIGPCCYEVGSDLVDAFAAAGHERHLVQRWFATPPAPRGSPQRPALRLDVAGANRDQLVIAGVDEASIHMCGLCTADHLDLLTSYRREKAQAGRLAGIIRAAGS